jgi:hypothetical protein
VTIEAADLSTTSVAEHFPPDTEVTITVTGRVVYHDRHGGLAIEYMNERGWPDRVVVRTKSPSVGVTEATAPSGTELRARAKAAGIVATSCADPERMSSLNAKWVARWNAAYPVDTPVRYWSGVREGEGVVSRTRTLAEVLGGHTAVVWLEAGGGAVALTHVEPIVADNPEEQSQ